MIGVGHSGIVAHEATVRTGATGWMVEYLGGDELGIWSFGSGG